MSAVNRGLRTASRSLRLQQRTCLRSAAPLAFGAASSRAALLAAPRLSSQLTNTFSTTAARPSAPVMPQGDREYDPEITDIASYVHNTPIDSELAVSLSCLKLQIAIHEEGAPLTPHPPKIGL